MRSGRRCTGTSDKALRLLHPSDSPKLVPHIALLRCCAITANTGSVPMDKTLEAAKAIASARLARTPLQQLGVEIAPRDEAEGYRIQEAVHAVLAPHVGPLVGYKIGCTSAVMQRYLGIAHPCGGGVFARGVHASGVSLSRSDYVRVGVECEIAVRLARDLAPGAEAFTAAGVADAIDAYHPAIEIVDDRYGDWRSIGAPTLVADDFFAAGCVLGLAGARPGGPGLPRRTGTPFCQGRRIRGGRGGRR